MSTAHLKSAIAPLRSALAAAEPQGAVAALKATFSENAVVHMCHPFGDITGSADYAERCLVPLMRAMPVLERRDMIVLAGTTPEGADWIGCTGYYIGTFVSPFLDLPRPGPVAPMLDPAFCSCVHAHLAACPCSLVFPVRSGVATS